MVLYFVHRRVWREARVAFGAALLLGLSPWYVTFDSYPVHDVVGLVGISLCLLALVAGKGTSWRTVLLLGIATTVLGHGTSSYILIGILGLFFLITAVDRAFGLFGPRGAGDTLMNSNTLLTVVVIVVSWGVFIATLLFVGIARFAATALSEAFAAPDFNAIPFSPVGVKPLHVVLATYLGFVTYVVTLVIGIGRTVLRKQQTPRIGFRFGIVGVVSAVAMASLWLVATQQGVDLLPRSITYLSVLSAPVAVSAIYRPMMHRKRGVRQAGRLVAIGVVAVILAPSLFYGMHPDLYLDPRPTSQGPNNNYEAWLGAGSFARLTPKSSVHWGVILGYAFVGGFGHVIYYETDFGGDLGYWIAHISYREPTFIYLRSSLDDAPDLNGFRLSRPVLREVSARYNLVYNAGGVIVLFVL
jgi:hypothetical protein